MPAPRSHRPADGAVRRLTLKMPPEPLTPSEQQSLCSSRATASAKLGRRAPPRGRTIGSQCPQRVENGPRKPHAERMKRSTVRALLPLLLAIGACGDHLGDYQLEDVRLVRVIPSEAFIGVEPPPYAEYLQISLSSEANLYDAETGAGLYTDADFCPLRNPNQMIAFGPVAADGTGVESWRRETRLLPSPRDGRYHYLVFVVPRSPARKLYSNATETLPAYDLRADRRDICLRFHVPGYNIIPSRSGTVEVPAARIANVLGPDQRRR